MSDQPQTYMTSTAPIGGVTFVTFDVTPAERNLIMRLRQLGGLAIVDSESMCLWPAGKIEQCNGKTPALPALPYRMDFT